MASRFFSSLSTKEDVLSHKKRLAPSKSDSHDTLRSATQSQTSNEPKEQLLVPENLYLFIQEALLLDKQIQEGKRDPDFESKWQDVMDRIDLVSKLYKTLGSLPSDWKFHPDTASICVPITCHPAPAKKKPKKIRRNPHMESSVPLDERGQKAWREFKKRDEDANITALEAICYPTPEEDKQPLEKTSGLVRFISAFAVEVFNKCYQMYINEGSKKNVSDAKIMDCKYLKFEDFYLFYVTLEAMEQGNLGVYETTIKCEFDDGAINLDTFVLMDHKPSVEGAKFSPEFKYKTLTDGSDDARLFYPASGMVRRSNMGGGYDFRHLCGSNRSMVY